MTFDLLARLCDGVEDCVGGEDEAGGLCSHNVSLASSRQPDHPQQQLGMVTPDLLS